MLTQTTAEAFASEWIEAWNSHDLDRILAHYSDDFESLFELSATAACCPNITIGCR
jgi:ketosteroid isomerase-like protein